LRARSPDDATLDIFKGRAAALEALAEFLLMWDK
jgi:hypothetical protein